MTDLSAFLDEMQAIGRRAPDGPWKMVVVTKEEGNKHKSWYGVRVCLDLKPIKNIKGGLKSRYAYGVLRGVKSDENPEATCTFAATARNNWDRLIQMNRVLLKAVENVISKDRIRGYPTGTEYLAVLDDTRTAIDKCKEIVGEHV